YSTTLPSPSATYTLSLHDALPIWDVLRDLGSELRGLERLQIRRLDEADYRLVLLVPAGRHELEEVEDQAGGVSGLGVAVLVASRSEEHTSELQSLAYLVCRLLLEK